jgi:flagellar biosynthesis GTPase FlhF
MIRHGVSSFAWAVGMAVATIGLSVSGARADDDDPPTRAARIADLEGSVSFQPAGTQDWVAPPVNRPMTTGDKLWADENGRAELQLDGAVVRLSSATAMSFLNLNDQVTQIEVTAGTLIVHVRQLEDSQTFEIDTPNLAFSVLRPGVYRLSVDDSGSTTAIAVRSGQGEVTGGGAAYALHAGESDSFAGSQLDETAEASPPQDAFEDWSASRDDRFASAASNQYVSPDVVGYEDLDANGEWESTPDYGYVWFPARLQPDWAPYHFGHWAYIAPWGYTWVDDQPWGYAPFHYGRWCHVHGAWGWVPVPRPVPGRAYVRAVYAPALVAWVGAGGAVAWFALGPREVFVPSYPVSQAYVRNINISNTTVTTTVLNNIYNTKIINKRDINVTYLNRSVPGAIAVTTTRAFTGALPIARNRAELDPRALANAPVSTLTPRELPTKQAVLGSGRVTSARPPAALLTRPVVARVAPPPAAPAFEAREQALRANGGKPLSVGQVRTLQPSLARNPAVRVAPAVTPVTPTRPVLPVRNDRPPTAIHPNELPQASRPPSPAQANSALEREHFQAQQRLQAEQEQERQRTQQQQEQEHQQLLQAQADAARRQQLEQQHQQQTQELMQRHLQEQQQLQQRQQEQQREQQQRLQEQQRQQQQHQQEQRHEPAAPPARPSGKPEDHR